MAIKDIGRGRRFGYPKCCVLFYALVFEPLVHSEYRYIQTLPPDARDEFSSWDSKYQRPWRLRFVQRYRKWRWANAGYVTCPVCRLRTDPRGRHEK